MRLINVLFLGLLGLASSLFAADNVVIYWNNEALNAIRLARTPPPVAAIHLATLHTAIHDAVASTTGQHHGLIFTQEGPPGLNLDAVVSSAAHTVIMKLWGEATNPRNIDVALENALKAIPDTPTKLGGVAFGKRVAEAVLANRATSGLGTPAQGVFSSKEPGKWRETAPGFRPAVLPQVATTRPFVMTSPSQFRCPPPPAVNSKEHADEVAYVIKVGARDGATRTEDETLASLFWADDLGSATPAGHWNVIAQDLSKRKNLDTVANARLFALLNLSSADAGISCWDTKYFYSTWRPETAAREMTKEINPHFTADPDFFPNMETPAHPDYTSGHSSFSGAASRALELYFGTDDIEFSTTADAMPGAVRTFKKLSDARLEVGMSRVWGGIHTMSANIEGQKAGMAIADFVAANALKPKKP